MRFARDINEEYHKGLKEFKKMQNLPFEDENKLFYKLKNKKAADYYASTDKTLFINDYKENLKWSSTALLILATLFIILFMIAWAIMQFNLLLSFISFAIGLVTSLAIVSYGQNLLINKKMARNFLRHYDGCRNCYNIAGVLLFMLSENINKIDEIVNSKIKFNKKKEQEILRLNLYSLRIFELLGDYKYSIIAMGSILELLLKKYAKKNNISPSDYHDIKSNRKLFCNYIQSAINENIFEKKKSWKLIQEYLRDFRNYIHINKEMKEDLLDVNWYNTVSPAFESILDSFINESPSL